jgi:di/tricarboxylate transporter
VLATLRRDPASAIAAAVSLCALAVCVATARGGGGRAAALAASLACLHLATAPIQALAHGCGAALRRDVLAAGALRSLLLVRRRTPPAPHPL